MIRPRLFVAGNWKMNGLKADLVQVKSMKDGLPQPLSIDVAIFPPATLLAAASDILRDSPITTGGQDCHAARAGAFTGDISAQMLKDAGASAVILGHSERRRLHGETSESVRAKASAAIEAGLNVIICVGETAEERRAGLAEKVCLRQLEDSLPETATATNTTVGYEPVWAIGRGVTPEISDIATMHKPLRSMLYAKFHPEPGQGWRILYGGSVTGANAAEIFQCDEVDGVLVGGASLKANTFLAIVAAGQEAAQRHPV
jgi:triosephosphate isomerase (TIM)